MHWIYLFTMEWSEEIVRLVVKWGGEEMTVRSEELVPAIAELDSLNSIQKSSPTKSCVLYRFVVSIGGLVEINAAKSGDF